MIAPAIGYLDFLERKVVTAPDAGLAPEEIPALNPALSAWQADVVRWALRRGRAALFEDTGLGKTFQQLEWARIVAETQGGAVLILTPLAVAAQTVREGAKFGIAVTHARAQADVRPGVNVANYERLHLFTPAAFVGVVLDESSILKSYMGKTKRAIVDAFAGMRFKLACTATPAPNDHTELGNHAEFLDVMRSTEMLSRWFINNPAEAGDYRLKRHAAADFWRWVSAWAVCISLPSDLRDAEGRPYSDAGYVLPPLDLREHIVGVDHSLAAPGELFRDSVLSAATLHKEMRLTASDRAARVAELVAADPEETWLLWCNTNYEADALRALLPEAVEVRGSDRPDEKERKLEAFGVGETRVLITKPSIAGFGLNFQHCARMAFVGLSYSYEQLYQALRRSYRFGQTRPVVAHLVIAETEVGVMSAIRQKQEDHQVMQRAMRDAMRGADVSGSGRDLRMEIGEAVGGVERGDGWTLYRGDCVEVARAHIADDSVGFSVFSPPFSNLYIYTDDLRDMGNTRDLAEFMQHFEYLIPEIHRVTIPGRLCAVHCKDLPLYRGRDGAAGLVDFPGEVRQAFERHGWTLHSKVTIWKSPVTEMQRTKNHGLLYKELCKDSTVSRQGMADYLYVFRKWTEEADFPNPVTRGGERFNRYVGTDAPSLEEARQPDAWEIDERAYSIAVWQRYASPVWFDIDQTDVLNFQIARTDRDEKHLCPLQLGVIERAVELWSNPGDLVFSPFTGVGSEGYVSLQLDRRFVGAELKESYFHHAVNNLKEARVQQHDIFNTLPPVRVAS